VSIELAKANDTHEESITETYFGHIRHTNGDIQFKLDALFLSTYANKKPNFGFNGMGEFVFYRTYSRLKEDGTKESFLDTLRRVVEGCYEIQRRHCRKIHIPWDYDKAQISAQEMFQRMWEFKFLPPGRGMWMMGTKFMWERGSAALCNCGFVSTDDEIEADPAEPFCFLMDMSMLGVGVGFDTKGAGKIQIKAPDKKHNRYLIDDSREGWVDSMRVLIWSYTKKPQIGNIQFDYSSIRKPGSIIKGFGGKASGPSILLELHELIREHLDRCVGKALTSVDITDLMNYIGRCVVAGNVRRTAEIAFGEPDDEKYCSMKNPLETLEEQDYGKFSEITTNLFAQDRNKASLADFTEDGELVIPQERLVPAINTWNSLNHHRWASNNSIFASVGMDYTTIGQHIASNGEPGLMWLDNMRDYGRMIDGRQPGIDGRVKGGNPCLEQSLESYELCVAGSTMLQMRDGVQPIAELVGKSIEIWNGDDWSKVEPRMTGSNRKLFRVHMSDGSYLDTTSNHGWLVKPSGKRVYRRVETQDLVSGSKSHPYSLGMISGRFEPNAFEMGYITGDGFLDLVDRPKYTRSMAVVCGSDEKMEALQLGGIPYKPQIKEGYADPYRRYSLKNLVTVEQTKELRDIESPIPQWVFEFDQESALEFIAGWIESDGSLVRQPHTDGYRIYGTEEHMRSLQLLLRRVGINHASVNLCHPKGQVTNKGVRKYDLWYVQISSFEAGEIPTRYKVAVKIGSRLRSNPRYPNKMIDMAKKQKIVRVEELGGTHDTFCFDEPDNHMGVFGNSLTYQCNLVETFPANHEDADDYMRTLKFAYLYAKTVTLLPTHNPRTNQVTLRNRRIGLSQSGIVQAFKKFGRRTVLKDFCDAGYHEIRRWDELYSEWLCIQKSIKVTSVKPSGTISLVVGTTPGIHHPEACTYWRRARIAKDSSLIPLLEEAGFHIEPDVKDQDRTVVVKFAISDDRVRPVSEVSMWEQMVNVVDYQRYWADNQVSCTIKFHPEEAGDIARIIGTFEDQLKGISFLPLSNHGYAQAPYEPCTVKEVDDYNATLKPADYTDFFGQEAEGAMYCDTDKCVIV